MRELLISRKLGKLDLNKCVDRPKLYSYWCRVAYAEFERWNYREHSHSFWELHLCVGGSACLLADGVEYTLTENTYIFLTAKCKHAFICTSEDYSEFVWGFCIEDNQELDAILYDGYKNPYVLNAPAEMLDSLSLILSNAEKSEFGYYDVIRNETYHIFLLLARNVGVESRYIYYKTQNNAISLIRKYIQENLPNDTSVDDISMLFGISKTSIERMCKKEYNNTFSQMKRAVRAEVIRELLQTTQYTMEEIADLTGFCDRYSMGKFFKKIEGQSPADYRKGASK